jgi:RES domain
MTKVCSSCVKHASLKAFIDENGVAAHCGICLTQGTSIDVTAHEFRQLVKALIRYFYDEWDYNGHWGGTSFDDLLLSDNPIFESAAGRDEDGLLDMIWHVTNPAYEDYGKGISLFAGYHSDGSPAGILRAIRNDIDPRVAEIEARLKVENYFNVQPAMKTLLKKHKGSIDRSIAKGSKFYRARVGFAQKKILLDMSLDSKVYHYEPYRGEEIAAPPIELTKAGRINRSGVSFFYGSTTARTAIAEVRPHPADIVSVGKFKTTRRLLVADFTNIQINHYSSSDKLLDEFCIIHSIGLYLNKTVPPEERSHYSVTQLAADVLRTVGYDGILFRSTVGKGLNIVIFHPEHLAYQYNGGSVFEIERLRYRIAKRPIIDGSALYW